MASISLAEGVPRLEQLVSGLLFVSEADSPWRLVQLGARPELDEASLLRALGKPESAQVTRQSLERLFARAIADQPWHGAAERDTVQRYRALLAFLSEGLDEARVYRVGTIEVEAYALGRTSDSAWLGVVTTLIET